MASQNVDDPVLSDSDGDLPPDRLKSTGEAHAMNMRSIAMTRESMEQIESDCKVVNKALRSLKECITKNLLCTLCGKRYKNPFTLQCGHSFCLECLQKYLENARVKYSEQAPRYHPIRASYIDALRCPRTNPESYLEAAQWVTDNPGPCYTCPLCEEVLSRSPIKDYRLKEMAESLQEHSGGTYDQDDRDGVENPGMFDRFLLL